MDAVDDTTGFSDMGGLAPTRRISENFKAGNADVTFVSSDEVLFYIHRKNLETNAEGFPSAEFDTGGEIVPLTETAVTLELLFQFIYPRRHPDLEDTTFEILAPLAEAAEKYQVFSAMTICKIRMKDFLPQHGVEIFNYASRHGYKDILSAAAPSVLDIPLDELVKKLSLQLVVPWFTNSLVRSAIEMPGAVLHSRQ
ncbi:hypothetical protein H0H81_004222 [Sphagnurus paluster]|uniref:BTB domain-containing protein n=1 Tax=Sphagnurus paluster TaxID=117069 RepID=A0A9P7K462_9AGAR|nr:hypothetical protein H0H81_004222 [Sphagnurus paluster]